jgi:hypothetical protein
LEGLEGRKDRQDHLIGNNINVVFHVVQIHINISIYHSVVHHVRLLEKNFLGHEHSCYDFIC